MNFEHFFIFISLQYSLKTDIQFGKSCNLKTLMVGTGVDTFETARSLDEKSQPDYFISSIGDLLEKIQK